MAPVSDRKLLEIDVDNFDLHPYGLYWSSSYDNKRQSVRCITMRGVVEWSNITMGLARVRAVRSV